MKDQNANYGMILGEIRGRLESIDKHLESLNDSVAKTNERMDQHIADDGLKHGSIWSAISSLRVRDAYFAAFLTGLWFLVQWLMNK